MQKEGRFFLIKMESSRGKGETEILQLSRTEFLIRLHDHMGLQGIDKVYQRILYCFERPGMKKACEKLVTGCLSCQQVKNPRKLKFPLQ